MYRRIEVFINGNGVYIKLISKSWIQGLRKPVCGAYTMRVFSNAKRKFIAKYMYLQAKE